MVEKSKRAFRAFCGAIVSTLLLLAATEPGEARPMDWTFTGYVEVQDPSGNPVANVPVGMEGTTRYDFRREGDPDYGVFWVWDTAFCSARGVTDTQGRAMLRCTIPWEQAEQANGQYVWIADSRCNVLERRELSHSASTLSVFFVAAFEGMELPLVKKFAGGSSLQRPLGNDFTLTPPARLQERAIYRERRCCNAQSPGTRLSRQPASQPVHMDRPLLQ